MSYNESLLLFERKKKFICLSIHDWRLNVCWIGFDMYSNEVLLISISNTNFYRIENHNQRKIFTWSITECSFTRITLFLLILIPFIWTLLLQVSRDCGCYSDYIHSLYKLISRALCDREGVCVILRVSNTLLCCTNCKINI